MKLRYALSNDGLRTSQVLRIVSAGVLCLMISSAAAAQDAFWSFADNARIPVAAASSQPVVGEIVFDENGVVASPYFQENRICSVKGCRRFVFDMRSGALIDNDGQWSDAYGGTGRGLQVIRIKAFTNAERPGPPPSDKPLEQAPRIKKVIRPNAQ